MKSETALVLKRNLGNILSREYSALHLVVHLPKADLELYRKWLSDFVEQGGEIEHFYSGKFPVDGRFRQAESSIEVVPLYGVEAISIIFKAGKPIIKGTLGHNTVYYWDNGRAIMKSEIYPGAVAYEDLV